MYLSTSKRPNLPNFNNQVHTTPFGRSCYLGSVAGNFYRSLSFVLDTVTELELVVMLVDVMVELLVLVALVLVRDAWVTREPAKCWLSCAVLCCGGLHQFGIYLNSGPRKTTILAYSLRIASPVYTIYSWLVHSGFLGGRMMSQCQWDSNRCIYVYIYIRIYILCIYVYIFSIYVYNMICIHPSINLSLAFLPGLTGLRPGCSGGEWPENVQNVRMPEAWQESNIWSRTQKPRMLEISANQTTKTWSSEPQPRVSPNLSWAKLGPKQAGWRAGRFGEARGGVSWAQETRHPQDRHVGGVGETPRRIITIYLNHIWIYLCKERYTKLKQDDLSKHMFKVFIERMERRINMDPFCYTYNKYILLLCN